MKISTLKQMMTKKRAIQKSFNIAKNIPQFINIISPNLANTKRAK